MALSISNHANIAACKYFVAKISVKSRNLSKCDHFMLTLDCVGNFQKSKYHTHRNVFNVHGEDDDDGKMSCANSSKHVKIFWSFFEKKPKYPLGTSTLGPLL